MWRQRRDRNMSWKHRGRSFPRSLWREDGPANLSGLQGFRIHFCFFFLSHQTRHHFYFFMAMSGLLREVTSNLGLSQDIYSQVSPKHFGCGASVLCQPSRRLVDYRPNPASPLGLLIKFYWHTATPTHLLSPKAAFAHRDNAEDSWQRQPSLQDLKIYMFSGFLWKICWAHCLWGMDFLWF